MTVADIDADRVIANEVAEGMHAIWFGYYRRLSSEMASDPAKANALYSRIHHCR